MHRKKTASETPPQLIVVGHYAKIYENALRFSVDGRFVISNSADGTTIFWNVAMGEIERLVVEENDRQSWRREDYRINVVLAKLEKTLKRRGWRRAGWIHEQVSPDGKRIAEFIEQNNPGYDSEEVFLCIAEMETGRVLLQTFFKPTSGFWRDDTLAFSADGELLAATGEEDKGVLIWKWRTQDTWRVLPGQDVRLFGVALDPDIRLVAVSLDGRQMWDAETGRLLHTAAGERLYNGPSGRRSPLDHSCVTLSPDGKRVAAGIGRGVVVVREWDTTRILLWQTQLQRAYPDTGPSSFTILQSVAFSPDGHTLATGGDDHLVRIWDVKTGELLQTFGRPIFVIEALAFAPDGKSLTALSDDGIARIWSLDEAMLISQEAHHLPPPTWGVSQIWETAARLWNSDRAALFADIALPEDTEILSLSPDGSLIVCKQPGDRLSVWNRHTQTSVLTLPGGYPNATAIFSSDNRFLAVDGYQRFLGLFDLEVAGEYQELVQDAQLFAFSPDGRILVIEHASHVLTLRDVRTLAIIATLTSPQVGPDEISVLVFSPDNNMLAISPSYDETGWLQRLDQKKKKQKGIPLYGHIGHIRAMAFSPDGTRVATGSIDGTIRLWETSKGTHLATLLALPEEEWVIFTPDSRYAASPGADPYLRWRIGDDLLPIQTYAQDRNILEHL